MKVDDLQEILTRRGLRHGAVRFAGGPIASSEHYYIVNQEGTWEVGYFERDLKNDIYQFEKEADACLFLVTMLENDKSSGLR